MPGLIEASVCIRSTIAFWASVCIVRSRALTTPLLTVGPPFKPSACPTAITSSPTCKSADLPNFAGVNLAADMLITAKSVMLSLPTKVAGYERPSFKVAVTRSAPSTTWLLVSILPKLSIIIPDPTPVCGTIRLYKLMATVSVDI